MPVVSWTSESSRVESESVREWGIDLRCQFTQMPWVPTLPLSNSGPTRTSENPLQELPAIKVTPCYQGYHSHGTERTQSQLPRDPSLHLRQDFPLHAFRQAGAQRGPWPCRTLSVGLGQGVLHDLRTPQNIVRAEGCERGQFDTRLIQGRIGEPEGMSTSPEGLGYFCCHPNAVGAHTPVS